MDLVKQKAAMSDSEQKPDTLPQRLCNEIQLFDLCDLDSCNNRSGLFCTDPVLLGRFEKIAEEEVKVPERCISEEIDEADDGDVYDDEFAMENFEGGEDDGCQDE
jgi:hypothetical protein